MGRLSEKCEEKEKVICPFNVENGGSLNCITQLVGDQLTRNAVVI